MGQSINQPLHPAGFTVITPNYLAHGLSVRNSFLQHHPGSLFFIAVLGKPEEVPEAVAGHCCFITELRDERIPQLLNQYTAFEMSCAAKPFFAAYLFDTHPELDHLVYLDGDILVFGTFEPPAASITISPHRIRHTGFLPESHPLSDTSLHRFGVFNAGYFEVRRTAEGLRFLDWWKEVLSRACYNDPDAHLFVDQLWLNAVPAFFNEVYINRHPGYNVGYWNLVERTISRQGDQWLVNGEPLRFYHYSHYRLEAPEQMSSFESPFLSFAQFPVLRPLYKRYEEQLHAHGYANYQSLPYSFGPAPEKTNKGLWSKWFGGNK